MTTDNSPHRDPAALHSAVSGAGATVYKSPAMRLAVARVLAGDPLDTPPARELSAFELEQIRRDLQTLRHTQVRDYTRGLEPGGARAAWGNALTVLRRGSTYRSRSGFGDPATEGAMRLTLQQVAERTSPLVLAVPLGGGKAANPTKTGNNHLPDLAEWTAWTMLAALGDALGEVLGRDVRVLTIPDAPLHTSDLAFSAAEATAHQRQAESDLVWLGMTNVVVADTLRHLPAPWPEEVRRHAEAAHKAMAIDPSTKIKADEQARSLLFSLNLRAQPASFARHVLLTAALGDPQADLPNDVRAEAEDLRRQVARATPHYIGVNHALRSLRVPQAVAAQVFGVEEVVRLTVHAKPGETRPALLPNGPLTRPGLLPMHGVGVLARGDRVTFATEFEVEARVARHQPLRHGGRFLAHAAPKGGADDRRALAA